MESVITIFKMIFSIFGLIGSFFMEKSQYVFFFIEDLSVHHLISTTISVYIFYFLLQKILLIKNEDIDLLNPLFYIFFMYGLITIITALIGHQVFNFTDNSGLISIIIIYIFIETIIKKINT